MVIWQYLWETIFLCWHLVRCDIVWHCFLSISDRVAYGGGGGGPNESLPQTLSNIVWRFVRYLSYRCRAFFCPSVSEILSTFSNTVLCCTLTCVRICVYLALQKKHSDIHIRKSVILNKLHTFKHPMIVVVRAELACVHKTTE